jgi:hypothetical protein
MPSWAWLLATIFFGGASAFLAMLGLSAGTAYGTEYHVLTQRQRAMAKLLGVGSLLGAVLCGLLAAACAFWTLRLWLA